MRDTLIDSSPPTRPATDSGLASRPRPRCRLTAADEATLPLRPTETALLRDWLHRLAR